MAEAIGVVPSSAAVVVGLPPLSVVAMLATMTVAFHLLAATAVEATSIPNQRSETGRS